MKPIDTIRVGKCEISVWQQQFGVSCSIRKNYFDKKANEWKSSFSFFPNELEDLGEAIKMALIKFAKDGQVLARPNASRHAGPPPAEPPKNEMEFEGYPDAKPSMIDEDDIPW